MRRLIKPEPAWTPSFEVANALDIGVIVVDSDLIIRKWNRWMEERSRTPCSEVIGRELLTFWPVLKDTGGLDAIREVLSVSASGRAHSIELVDVSQCPIIKKLSVAGRSIPSRICISGLPSPDGCCLIQIIPECSPKSLTSTERVMDPTFVARSAYLLRTGLRDKEFRMEFQPVVDRSAQVVGFEGLLRWSHKGHALSPEMFIATAEETGLIHELGWEGLSLGLRTLGVWIRDHNYKGFLSVNISPLQLKEPDFYAHLVQMVIDAGVPPKQVVLEITERAIIENQEVVKALMRRLKRKGFRFALDDFGAGYASLSHLYQFTFDIIKLDGSFLQGVSTCRGRTVFQSVVKLAKQLSCQLIVEGIETKNHVIFVKKSCNFLGLQGYYFYRPLDVITSLDLVAQLA